MTNSKPLWQKVAEGDRLTPGEWITATVGDLHAAAECIRDLSDRAETQRAAGAELVRQVLAARESLS